MGNSWMMWAVPALMIVLVVLMVVVGIGAA